MSKKSILIIAIILVLIAAGAYVLSTQKTSVDIFAPVSSGPSGPPAISEPPGPPPS